MPLQLTRFVHIVIKFLGACVVVSLMPLSTEVLYGQRTFPLDYVITYRNSNFGDTSRITEHFFTNSKDNSYFGILTEVDSMQSKLSFFQHEGIYFHVYLKTKHFQTSKALNIPCVSVKASPKHYRKKSQKYQFVLMGNKGARIQYRLLSSLRPEKQKRKKIGYIDYEILKGTSFHDPIFIHPIAFKQWREGNYVPNGIFKRRTFINFKGAVEEKRILLGYSETAKSIVIPEKCAK